MTFFRQPTSFLLSSVFGSLGGGFGPAINSVGLEIYRRAGGTETGKFLGALDVIQVIGYVSLQREF